jgi:hypothetical protein
VSWNGLDSSERSQIEIEAGEPGLILAQARGLVEQAVLEGKLEARGISAARADDEIHRVLVRQRRLGDGGAAAPRDEGLHGVGAGSRHEQHEHTRGKTRQVGVDRTREVGGHRPPVWASAIGLERSCLHAQDALLDSGLQPEVDLISQFFAGWRCDDDREGRPGDDVRLARRQEPFLGRRRLRGGGAGERERQQGGQRAAHARSQSRVPSKLRTRKSTKRRTFAERCLRLG